MKTYIFAPSLYWMSVAEAAIRSRCSEQAIRVRIHDGKFSAMKRYGQWLINTRSLQNYMQDRDQPKEKAVRVCPGWEF
jgi:Helix-turn-helix domain